MTDFNKLSQNVIVNGNSTVQTYLRNGINLPVQGIEEFGIITINNLVKNQVKTIDLSEIPYSLNVRSLCGYEGTALNAQISLKVKQGVNTIVEFQLADVELPYIFPENCINPQVCSFELLCTEAIATLHIFYKQAYLVDSYIFD